MELNHYQMLAEETAIYPKFTDAPIYPALGLAGESGEVADKVKKLLRDYNGKVSSGARHELGKELGDVLWYVAMCARDLGYSLDQIAMMNIVKLSDRKRRDKISGEGDNR